MRCIGVGRVDCITGGEYTVVDIIDEVRWTSKYEIVGKWQGHTIEEDNLFEFMN